ncbi:MAG: 1-acyl-sn-glycerol-3-phosphate acyltransferase [Gillisia sp.]
MKFLVNFFYTKVLGWKIEGKIDPEIRKCIIIVAPHTSWYDFLIGALVRKIIALEIHYVAKKELFAPPFGWYFSWMGGIALDRTPKQQKTEAIARLFEKKEILRLAISPEGTRKKITRWRTGFYYIAKKANVSIIMVAFDYGAKTVRFSDPFSTSEDFEEDFKKIAEFYAGVKGKVPENF